MAYETLAVAAAMPAVAAALDGLGLYSASFGAMLATSIVGMGLAGMSCDRHGPLRSAALGLALFGFGLTLAGSAGDMAWVVVGRALQGLGSGMLGVALYVGMGRIVPPELHPRLFALFATAWVVPGLVGPSIATWLVGAYGWRSVFLVAAVAAVPAAALLLPAYARLARPPATTPPPAAAPGALAWATLGAVGALVLHGNDLRNVTGSLALLLLGGLVTTAVASHALLPPGSLRARPGMPATVALRGMIAAAFMTAEVFVPLALTQLRGWSLAESGVTLSVAALFWSAGSALQARIDDPLRRRLGMRGGFGMLTIGIAIIAVAVSSPDAGWGVVPGWAVAGFGIGLAFPMLSVLTLQHSTPEDQGRNASALQLGDALGSTAVLAVAGALFHAIGGHEAPLAYVAVLGLASALAAGGALMSDRAFEAGAPPPQGQSPASARPAK